jgi:hypothetical protein
VNQAIFAHLIERFSVANASNLINTLWADLLIHRLLQLIAVKLNHYFGGRNASMKRDGIDGKAVVIPHPAHIGTAFPAGI